ncbi:MAG: ribosome recycling factor [Candidatus Peribacteraceae bacterium]|nr:ribosome recycling factor [Candidatus Peribacteraceae bacterium]MDD5742427.1 ribosome recycling factor [Candidatus Peribacteraceae bacterium]
MSSPRVAAFGTESDKVLKFLQTEFSKLQTGRASAALVDHLEVEAYGHRQQLKTLAGVTVQDARSLVIQPWDRSILANVEKALQTANLGTSPVNDGQVLRINLPPMTEERRKELTKVVQKLAEEAKITIRQHRQAVLDKIKTEEKNEDARFTQQDELQKLVDKVNLQIEELRKKKEQEVMTV